MVLLQEQLRQQNSEDWHHSLDGMRIRDGHFQYTELARQANNQLEDSKRDNPRGPVLPCKLWHFAFEEERKTEIDDNKLSNRHSDWMRKDLHCTLAEDAAQHRPGIPEGAVEESASIVDEHARKLMAHRCPLSLSLDLSLLICCNAAQEDQDCYPRRR
eukprot:m.158410 g.158410  ORF g.158410 m.158410 type:complete len:158 (+) comp16332_c0_seq4:996-1469(+)